MKSGLSNELESKLKEIDNVEIKKMIADEIKAGIERSENKTG